MSNLKKHKAWWHPFAGKWAYSISICDKMIWGEDPIDRASVWWKNVTCKNCLKKRKKGVK